MCYLRKANSNDFETYKELFEDKEYRYQWLYYHYQQQITLSAAEQKEQDEFKIATAEFQNYTLKRFHEDLENFRIFMVCEENQILGYVKLAKRVNNGKCKIHECALFKEVNQIKKEVFTKLFNSKKSVEKFYLFTSDEVTAKFLLRIGFKREKSLFILQKS